MSKKERGREYYLAIVLSVIGLTAILLLVLRILGVI